MKLKSTNWASELHWPITDKVLMSLIFVDICGYSTENEAERLPLN